MHAFDPTVDEELAKNKTSKNLSFSKIALFREAADDLDFGSGSLNKGMPFKNILERWKYNVYSYAIQIICIEFGI